jgi:4-amino-4-deoxy-L-arabinose transferase-like glycosyltransferase
MNHRYLRQGTLLLALCLLAVALRLAAIVALRAWEQPNPMEHAAIATNLLEGRGFSFSGFGYFGPSSVQSPPYPVFLASLFWIFGIGTPAAYGAAMAVNALLGGLAVWLTYKAGLALRAGPRVSLAAAALCAIWPTQIYAAAAAQAITMITVAVLALIVLFHKAIDERRIGPWIGFSIVGCLAALTEPVLLPALMLVGMAFVVWPRHWPLTLRVRFAAVLFVAGVSILGPWTLRNYLVHDTLMPVKSTFWVNVWKGNNPHATGTDRLPLSQEQRQTLAETPLWKRDRLAKSEGFDDARQYDRLTPEQLERLSGKPDAEREKVFKDFATTWIAANPGRYLELCGLRLFKTVWVEWDNPKSWNPVYLLARSVLLMGTFAGLIIAVKQRWRLGFVALLVGSSVVLITMTVTAARFALPFEPLQFIGACALLGACGVKSEAAPARS